MMANFISSIKAVKKNLTVITDDSGVIDVAPLSEVSGASSGRRRADYFRYFKTHVLKFQGGQEVFLPVPPVCFLIFLYIFVINIPKPFQE